MAWGGGCNTPPHLPLAGELIKEDLGKGEGGWVRTGAFVGSALCRASVSPPSAVAGRELLPQLHHRCCP